MRERKDWPEPWDQLVRAGSDSVVSFDGAEMDEIDKIFAGFNHAGESAFDISVARD